MIYPSKLYATSEDGFELANDLGNIRIERQVMGNLCCPSGKIVACDPLTLFGALAYEQEIPPGAYSVELNIAHIGDSSHQRVATATLRIGPGQPIRWKMATLPGEKLGDLKEDQIFGYGVDLGTGSFMDIQAAEVLRGRFAKDEKYESQQPILEALRSTAPGMPDRAVVTLDPISGLNFAIFSSGFGDGAYTSYWGYDDADNVTCLMTDFGLLIDGDPTQ